METATERIETLRLLRAFMHIADPEKRREIIALLEALADECEKDDVES